jgi:hypothetical protein
MRGENDSLFRLSDKLCLGGEKSLEDIASYGGEGKGGRQVISIFSAVFTEVPTKISLSILQPVI